MAMAIVIAMAATTGTVRPAFRAASRAAMRSATPQGAIRRDSACSAIGTARTAPTKHAMYPAALSMVAWCATGYAASLGKSNAVL